MLVSPESNSHWYDPATGEPRYESPSADGKRTIKTTLLHARKHGYVPSVTNIMSLIRKPGLDAWKAEQYILAAWEHTGDLTATLEAADEISRHARETGIAYHDDAERIALAYKGEAFSPDVPQTDAMPPETRDAVMEWVRNALANVTGTEISFGSSLWGWGGRVDLVGIAQGSGKSVVCDWKTQRTQPGKPIKRYDEWGWQLAAYARGFALPNAILLNCIISTTEPGRVESYSWENYDELLDTFTAIFRAWCAVKKYHPGEK